MGGPAGHVVTAPACWRAPSRGGYGGLHLAALDVLLVGRVVGRVDALVLVPAGAAVDPVDDREHPVAESGEGLVRHQRVAEHIPAGLVVAPAHVLPAVGARVLEDLRDPRDVGPAPRERVSGVDAAGV